MFYSKLTKTLALSLALAATALMAPQLAEPAHAGSVVSRFNEGDIVKLKTTWGGGFVLNFGGTSGSTAPNTQAIVHWNTSWDNPNRFYVSGPWFESGMYWHMLVNKHSGLCLSANYAAQKVFVTQQTCNVNANSQWWSGEWWPGFNTAWIRNLAHHRAGLTTVLTQQNYEHVGSKIWMENLIGNDGIRQEWVVHSCRFNGVEQKDC